MIMRTPNEMEAARQARRSVSVVRKKLLNPTPEILGSCAPHLRVAIESLGRLQVLLARPALPANERMEASARRGLQAEVDGLRRELGQAQALLRGASCFYDGLARLLAPAADEAVVYARGGAIPARPGPVLQVEA